MNQLGHSESYASNWHETIEGPQAPITTDAQTGEFVNAVPLPGKVVEHLTGLGLIYPDIADDYAHRATAGLVEQHVED